MSLEFTGERVVPGLVDANLWNEHLARYRFAARVVGGLKVLDAGCGTGYGSEVLALAGALTTGLDLAEEALLNARQNHTHIHSTWAGGSCEALPFRREAFDAIVAFEVIEHLSDQTAFLAEARRVLSPAGLLIVSTPNRDYYTESRAQSGPNPFHTHEFTFAEFDQLLQSHFEYVDVLLQDHTEGLLFQSVRPRSLYPEIEDTTHDPDQANFFVAMCSRAPLPAIDSYLFLPRSANLLKERGAHIARLQSELAVKDEWLQTAAGTHSDLLRQFREQTTDLESSNRWAQTSKTLAEERGSRILELQAELQSKISAYQARLDEVEREFSAYVDWSNKNEQQLNAQLDTQRSQMIERSAHMHQQSAELERQTAELSRCVELLHESEALVVERTKWALSLEEQRQTLQGQIAAARYSRWLRLGKKLGIGPEFSP